MTPAELDAYLDRIGHAGAREPSLQVVAALARAHAQAIPFENLAVLATGAPDLALRALQDKLVRRRRGGYCYEHNALLQAALQALGFQVVGLSARVRHGVPADTDTPRSHMVLLVRLQGRPLLVDAGFGSLTLTAPVRLDVDGPQPTPHEPVRTVPHGDDAFELQALVGDAWQPLYRFDLVRQLAVDYVQQNWHTATRPGALFANNLVVARPAPDGRHVLFNRTLTRRRLDGSAEKRTIESEGELQHTLRYVFGLEPGPQELAAAWAVGGRGQPVHVAFG
jgi:N-hydroxyarylamine O-acetyltransferase